MAVRDLWIELKDGRTFVTKVPSGMVLQVLKKADSNGYSATLTTVYVPCSEADADSWIADNRLPA